jgi:phosphatidylserine decarboxylase
VKLVEHHNGHFHKAWLPKASDENEMTDIIITTEDGVDILCRQVAGAMARRIVTYAKEGDDCYIDEHMGFIKFGSRVDLFLPVDTKICVGMRQSTTGNQTIIGMLNRREEI